MWLGVLLLVVLVILAELFKNRTKTFEINYRSAGNLLTPAEFTFWQALLPALPQGVVACPKVRLIDVITPQARGDIASKNRVIQKHLDFVLMDVATASILAGIELDDSSHSKPSRVARDQFLEAAMQSAAVPLLRFPVSRSYSTELIATAILNLSPARQGRSTTSPSGSR